MPGAPSPAPGASAPPNRAAAALPVQTVTGFLGAGKTTLIRRLLQGRPAQARVAVVVNEFGQLPFDGAMLRDTPGQTSPSSSAGMIYDLPGGCICCTQAAQLGEMLDRLAAPDAAGRPAFTRVLIEASGAATADGIILNLFSQPVLPGRIPLELAPTVAVVDCNTILTRLTWDIFVLKQQLQVADLVVLNRSAELPASRRGEMEAAIRQYAPLAPLLPEPAVADAWDLICRPRFGDSAVLRPDAAAQQALDPAALGPHRLHEGMEQLDIALPAAVNLTALTQILEHWSAGDAASAPAAATPGARIFRAKGFVQTPQGVRAIELAGGRVFQRSMSQVDGCPVGRLAVIGKNLPAAKLESALAQAASRSTATMESA